MFYFQGKEDAFYFFIEMMMGCKARLCQVFRRNKICSAALNKGGRKGY